MNKHSIDEAFLLERQTALMLEYLLSDSLFVSVSAVFIPGWNYILAKVHKRKVEH